MPEQFSQFGASGAVVVVVFMFLKFMRDERLASVKSHDKLVDSLDKNTRVSQQTYEFLENLNGSMRRTVRQKQEGTYVSEE